MKTPFRTLGLAVLFLGGVVANGHAATFYVTTQYEGQGSLRQAILDANANPGADTISFAIVDNIGLTSPLPVLASDLTITNDCPGLAIRAYAYNGATPVPRLFEIAPGYTITISGLRFDSFSDPTGGSAILNHGSNVTINHCLFSENSGYAVKNTADAGQAATLVLRDCTFWVSITSPLAIENTGAGQVSLVVTNTVFSTHFTAASGVIHNAGKAVVTNCTLLVNTNDKPLGVAIYNDGPGAVLDLRNCTLAGKSEGALGYLLYNAGGSVAFANNIFDAIGSTRAMLDAAGDTRLLQSAGHNLSSDAAGGDNSAAPGGYLNASGDIRNTDPLLASFFLFDNGGLTQTLALLSGSPAINNADPAKAPSRDQRNYIRIEAPDIGAYEDRGVIPSGLANISTRARVGTGNDVLIAGCILRVAGQPHTLAVRALGPSLPLAGALSDPEVEVRTDSPPYGSPIASNDNWQVSPTKQQILDLGLAPPSPSESATVAAINSQGSYGAAKCTAVVSGVNNQTGIGLVELYELDRTKGMEPLNMSTRGFVGTGDDVMIAGFIVLGPDSLTLAVRALGPSTSNYITDPLQNPALQVYDQNGTTLAANDDWQNGGQKTELFVRGLSPRDDREAAAILTVVPGAYTAIVRGVGNTTGVGLVELYRL